MIILEIDNGNTSLKWRLIRDVGNSKQQVINSGATRLAQFADMASLVSLEEHPERVRIVNVAGQVAESTLLSECRRYWQASVAVAKSTRQVAGVRNAYTRPSTLGTDRWLALIAAHHAYPNQLLCVVDCGSAVTIDLLEAQGQHLGGYIAPGYRAMYQALNDGTAIKDLLPESSLTTVRTPAISTQEAVSRGTSLMVFGLLDACFARIPTDAVWVFTGGDAKTVLENSPKSLRGRMYLHETLVLDGLKYVLP